MNKSTPLIYAISILVHQLLIANASHQKYCLFASNDAFQSCSKVSQYTTTEEYHHNRSFCSRTFTVSRVKNQAFLYSIRNAISTMLGHCCGGRANLSIIKDFKYMTDVNHSSINTSDFVYPILGRYHQNHLHGHYFVPMFDLPSGYYLTLANTKEIVLKHTVHACSNLWPVLAISILAAMIAGFVAWCFETRKNTEEFPGAFHVGLFEGFWWAFISMTTVGYGDKAPRSVMGRIFTICWILIGITILSIFTASITTEIMNARTHPEVDMQGKRIGCLPYRLNDVVMIAQHGGIPETIKHDGTMTPSIGELLLLLQKKAIDGILLNKQTYFYFIKMTTRPQYAKQKAIFDSVKLIHTEVFLKGDRLAYGMLIKEYHDYEFFGRYIENNWLHIQTCRNIKNNNSTTSAPEYFPDFFSPKVGLFNLFLYYSLGTLGVIFSFGALYEVRRYFRQKVNIDGQDN